MPPTAPIRSTTACRATTAALVLALLLAAAAPASAVTRRQATAKAVAALGADKASSPVVVFSLPERLRAGTRVTQEGTKTLVAKVRREAAFFFYLDAAPSQPYPHAGRVALVGVRSGKLRLSRTFTRRPLVDGRLPAFLRSANAYGSTRYRVLDTSARASEPKPADPQPAAREQAPTATITAAKAPPPLVADPLAVPLTPNAHPKAHGQEVLVKEGFGKRIVLTGHDDDGDDITFAITKQPQRGTLTGAPPEVVYTPAPGYIGPDHFTFKTDDSKAQSNAAQAKIRVVELGRPPAVTTSAGCTPYTEQDPAVVVDGQIAVSDPDDTVLDSARVRIADGFQDGDNLLFSDQNGISGSYEEDAGVLTLTGTSSVANYQAALGSVSYRNLTSGNPSPTKDFEFVVNDAGNDSDPAVKQVCVTGGATGGNDRPTGETGEGALSYVENDGPLPADGAFTVGDQDSPQLSGATVKFVPVVTQAVDAEGEPVGAPVTTVTFAPAEDALAFADQSGIAGAYDAATGVLTLTGAASIADYEAALRSVTYENSSEDPSDATRRIQFQVTDAEGANSVPARRDIFVEPVNDAPEVAASAGSTHYTGSATPVDGALSAIDVDDDDLEGATVTIASGLAAGDSLVFADQSGISGAYDAETGVLTLSGSAPVGDYETALRSVAFAHAEGTPSGERTIEIATNDGELGSGTTSKHVEINDQPALDAAGDPIAYTENEGPVAAAPGITAADADSASLAGATVAISSGFAAAEDALAFTDQSGITGAYDSATGVLTLSGTASVADYEAALRSVTYENVSDDPTAARTLAFRIDDGAVFNNVSAAVTRDVAITAVNDAPQVTTSAGATAFSEGDPSTPLDAALDVVDADDAALEGAEVRMGAGFQPGDELTYAEQAGIAGAYDALSGALTLTGTATVAEYEAALRSVEYRHTGDGPEASKTVEVTVSDGDETSAFAAKDVAVTGVNDRPVLDTTDATLAYTEGDGAVAVDPGLTATDPDSATLAGATVAISSGHAAAEDALGFADQSGITGAYDTATGVLTLSGTATVAEYEAALRSVTYANASADPTTARTVSFRVDDGGATDNLSDAATRDLAIAGVAGTAPVITPSAGASTFVIGGAPVTVDPTVTVTDVDDTALEGARVAVTSGFEAGADVLELPAHPAITGAYDPATGVLTLAGTATLADYQAALRSIVFRYTGDNPSGERTIVLTATDGDATSAAATKALEIRSAPEE